MKDNLARERMFNEQNNSREEHDEMAKHRKEAMDADFLNSFNRVSKEIYDNAVKHGWWETDRNDGEMMMLMVTELAEACEGDRIGNPPDDKIPEFTSIEAEMADAVIRIMDYCHQRGFRLGKAILAKHQYNVNRPYKHGGKKY